MKILTTLALLSQILQSILAKEDPLLDQGQCTTTNTDSDDVWNGTLSFNINPTCQLVKPVYSWTIVNPALVNITSPVVLELTFHNFTTENSNNAKCDQSDRIEVMEYVGSPTTVCRSNQISFTETFKIHQYVMNSEYIKYSHYNNEDVPSFNITYRFPDYPCFKCNEGDTCEKDACLDSENKCSTLQQAFKCVRNPCFENPCDNNGTCSRKIDDKNAYSCTCLENYTGKNCTDEKPCSTVTCENGGKCVVSSENIGVCECPPDIWGESCQTINDGTFCSPEVDKYNGSKIIWKATKSGHTDTEPCPFANGTATRKCNSKEDTPLWAQPDLSLCVSPDFSQLLTDVGTLLEAEEVTSDAILNITSVVQESIKQNGKKRLYAGDLAVATDTVEKVSSLVKKVDSSEEELIGIAKGCGNAVSSIIDPVQSNVWSFSKVGYLEDKITTILRSMEELATNFAEKASDIKTGRVKRNTEYSIDSSQSYTITTENIAFSIHVLDRASNFSSFTPLGTNQMIRNASGTSTNTFLSVPTDVFDSAMLRTSDAYIHMYTAKLTSVATLLAETNSIIRDIPPDNVTKQLNSEIISLKVLNVGEDVFQTLTHPVKLSFSLQDSNLSSRLDQKCVFL
ncbi:cadherin EGF LAG seven-pass G-type receptor 2-like, partial [Ruditapes philippinarum]|uniref:cadherin EGF LAG seven-pass G-type receptor 2-like n=1 Tax=Ruditapes philippinarum TaxID=129788 RepID=UPI00295A714E